MQHQSAIRKIYSIVLLATAVPCLAITSTPVPQIPANGSSNWLFNGGTYIRWSAVSGATYVVVISDNPNFNNFNQSSLTCINSGCIKVTTANAYVTPSNLSGYWFYGTGTYYWKIRASTPTGGTGAWSQVYSFSTTSTGLRTTVSRAVAYIDNASLQSLSDTKNPSTWATDMASNDGTRHRTAMNRLSTFIAAQGGYSRWVKGGRVTTTTLRSTMSADLNTYGTTASQIVTRMIALYAGSVPANDDGMMALLGYRAQCKEFADRMVAAGGLTPRSYSYGKPSAYPRPGFYVFNRNNHAGLVRAVSFTTGGTPQVQIIESNWGTGWSNPMGAAPWLRVIAGRRILTINGLPYVAIDPS